MTTKRFAGLLLLFSLAVRLPILLSLRWVYYAGGISTSLGLVARNLVEGRGLRESIGPSEIQLAYSEQFAALRLKDVRDLPNPPGQTTVPLIQRMPAYPVLLAAIWKVTGDYRYLPVQVLQILLSALIPLILYDVGRRLFGEASGRMAGVLGAVNVPEIRLAVAPLYDWWVLFLAALLLLILGRAAGRGFPARDCLAMAGIFAAGVYFKSTVLALPILLAAALFLVLPRGKAAARAALLLGVPILALLPWAIRNQRVFDRFILTNTFFWPTIWEGFGEVENRFGAHLDDRLTYLTALAEKPDLVYASPQYDDYIRPRVINVFEYHPDFVLSLWTRRFVRALLFPGHSWGIASVEDPEKSLAAFQVDPGGTPLQYARARPMTVLVKLLQKIWDPLLFGLAFLTLVVDRSRWREFLPFLAVPAAMLAVTVPLHFEARYLLPASLVWILLAAVPLAATFFPSPPAAADVSSAPSGS